MDENLLTGLALVIVLGIGAQWISWRVRQPSILLLLLFGFLAGPIAGVVDPDALLGSLLMPFVSLAVALILFEGGLSLHLSEVQGLKGVLGRLLILGGVITMLVTTLAAHYIVGLDTGMAALLGAVLVVSGPTVVMPLLRHVRPNKQVASLLKWEAMVIDCLGAVVAVLVYQGLLSAESHEGPGGLALVLFGTIAWGAVAGAIAAGLLLFVLERDLVPDYLQSPVTLMMVVGAFALSNHVLHESGLVTVTLMGAFLANQRRVTVKHIIEFKENLRVLLLSTLFILLSARIELAALRQLGWNSLVFLLVLVLVARPLSVGIATMGSPLTLKERTFLAWMHPRGVVSAAVAAIFALRLAEQGHEDAGLLVPLTFLVIVGTLLIYGPTSSPVARALGLAQPDPQGLLILGSSNWTRKLAKVLQDEGVTVLFVDSNRQRASKARMDGLPVHHGDALAEHEEDELDLTGIGRLLALTPNDHVNSLAALHFSDVFGKANVYQLSPGTAAEEDRTLSARELRGKMLWHGSLTAERLALQLASGGEFKKTRLTEEFDFSAFSKFHEGKALPLFLLNPAGKLQVLTPQLDVKAMPGDLLVSLLPPPMKDARMLREEAD